MNASVPESSLSADVIRYLRYQLRGRRGFIVLAAAVVLPALWFGWPWLVIAGIAPLILAFAPCAIMCGLGLCMMKSCKKQDSGQTTAISEQSSDGGTLMLTAPDKPGSAKVAKPLTNTSSCCDQKAATVASGRPGSNDHQITLERN